MMGLTDFFHEKLRKSRIHELKLSVRFRWIIVQLNALGKDYRALNHIGSHLDADKIHMQQWLART